MARPKKQTDDKRTEQWNTRWTLAEREYIRTQASAAGMNETEYLRHRALGHQIHPAPSRGASDPALVSELNRIGVNVNQLALATHRGSDFTRYWMHIGGELRTVLHKVMAHDGS
ncbi:MAG: plasmid mobilization relaxosome protein MobC [Pseudomonadota bacterium]